MATKRRGGKGKSKDSKEKVKKAAKTDTGGSLAERRKRIRERYSRPVVVYEKDPTAEHVPLDFVALARLLGGGVKKGSIVEVYGPEDAGKTSFSVAVAGMIQRRAAKKQKHVVMLNFELAEDRPWWATLGLLTDDAHFTMLKEIPLEEGVAAVLQHLRQGSDRTRHDGESHRQTEEEHPGLTDRAIGQDQDVRRGQVVGDLFEGDVLEAKRGSQVGALLLELPQALGELRTTMTAARLVAQAVAVEAHQCRFRSREERGQHQQQDEQPDQGR